MSCCLRSVHSSCLALGSVLAHHLRRSWGAVLSVYRCADKQLQGAAGKRLLGLYVRRCVTTLTTLGAPCSCALAANLSLREF